MVTFVITPLVCNTKTSATLKIKLITRDTTCAVLLYQALQNSYPYLLFKCSYLFMLAIVRIQPGGYFPKNWVGVCGALLETLTLFQTKICDFPYHISDVTQDLIPYFRPDANLCRLHKHLRRTSYSQR